MGLSEEKKQPADRPLAEDELDAVSGGVKNVVIVPDPNVPTILCKACDRRYPLGIIHNRKCPKGHDV